MIKKELTRAIGKVVLPPLGYLLMRFFWYTSKKHFHIDGEISQEQCVVICWHGELMMSPQAYRYVHKKQKASGIISRHFDGEIIARILQIFSVAPLRGSSSSGAKQVLLEAFRALKRGDDLLVTPDGPKGPRYSVGNGAVALAHKAKIPVLSVNYTASSYWQLGSWDRFVVPKPFSKIDFFIQSLSLEGMSIDEAREHLRSKMLTHAIV